MRTNLAVAMAVLAISHSTAFAEPVYYDFDYRNVVVTYQGTLYRDAALTLTIKSDTTDVVERLTADGPVYSVFGSMTFAIGGGPSGSATLDARVYYEAYSGWLYLYVDGGFDEFSRQYGGMPPFIRRPLAENFTSLTTRPQLAEIGFRTSGGLVAAFGDPTSTVRFRVTVAPEPGALLMGLSAALVCVAVLGYRRSYGR